MGIIDGKPRKRRGRTDYLLCLPLIPGKPPLAVAVLEAKAEDKLASLGIQQSRDYGRRFNTPFVFSTNGHLFAEFAEDTQHIRDALPLVQFPTPDELRQRYEALKKISLTSDADLRIHNQLVDAARILGLRVVDPIIVTKKGDCSFQQVVSDVT